MKTDGGVLPACDRLSDNATVCLSQGKVTGRLRLQARKGLRMVCSHEELNKLAGYRPGCGDDGWSWAHRPGSWEWNTSGAAAARELLLAAGLQCEEDPEAHWRVRWVKQ